MAENRQGTNTIQINTKHKPSYSRPRKSTRQSHPNTYDLPFSQDNLYTSLSSPSPHCRTECFTCMCYHGNRTHPGLIRGLGKLLPLSLSSSSFLFFFFFLRDPQPKRAALAFNLTKLIVSIEEKEKPHTEECLEPVEARALSARHCWR